MTRWVPAAELMVPWEVEEMFPEDGLLRLTQFMTLVTSARNWNTTPRSKLMLRNRPASISLRPGPIRELRPTLPSAPPGPMPPGWPGPLGRNACPAAWANATVVLAALYVPLNHCVKTLFGLWPVAPHTRQRCGSSLGLTPGTALGRLAFALSKFLSDPVDTVNGKPLCK